MHGIVAQDHAVRAASTLVPAHGRAVVGQHDTNLLIGARLNLTRTQHLQKALGRRAQQIDLHGAAGQTWCQVNPTRVSIGRAAALVDPHVRDCDEDMTEWPLRRATRRWITDSELYCGGVHGAAIAAAATEEERHRSSQTQEGEKTNGWTLHVRFLRTRGAR